MAGGVLNNLVDWWNQPGPLEQSGQVQATTEGMPLAEKLKYMLANDPMAQSFGVGNIRPYGTAPNSLMGFRKSGPNVAFDDSKYPHTQWVDITFPNGETYTDAIKGMNKSHAVERARRNWPGAEIEPTSAPEGQD